jgi:hypothetical protein
VGSEDLGDEDDQRAADREQQLVDASCHQRGHGQRGGSRLDDVGPPYLRVGTVYRYPISAVEAWIAESVRGNIAS